MTVRDTLLLADPSSNSRAALRKLYEDSYNILEAGNCDQAALLLQQDRGCIAAVLADHSLMAESNYRLFSVMEQSQLLSAIPVIMIVESSASELEARALEQGAADVIARTLPSAVAQRRLKNIVSLYHHKERLNDLEENQSQSLLRSNETMVDALSSLIEQRGVHAIQHTPHIREFTRLLLNEVMHTYPEYALDARSIKIITSAAALHDIGKISVPESILNKVGKLSHEEFEIAASHIPNGCKLLARLGDLEHDEYLLYAYQICRCHHERWDGNGYPDGLSGNEIPIAAQVVGLADAYDALTTHRTYRAAYSCEQATAMILNGECGVFSPQLLACFKQLQPEFSNLVHQSAGNKKSESPPGFVAFPAAPPRPTDANPLQESQAKNQALLQYLGATVVEVSLPESSCRLLYNPNPDLSFLSSVETLEDAIHFLSVDPPQPDNRDHLAAKVSTCLHDFFDAGLRRQSKTCRIFSALTADYHTYSITLLRIDPQDLTQRKCLVILEKPERLAERSSSAVPGVQAAALADLLGIVQSFHNDRYLTMFGSSKGLCALLGYSEEELHTQFHDHLIELIPQKEQDSVLCRMQDQLAESNNLELEFQLCHKDGEHIWVLTKGYLLTDTNGEEYLYGMMLDISQSKKAEEGLRLSLERHQIIMEQANDIVFELDFATDTLVCSPMWEKRFGYPPICSQASTRLTSASHFHPDDMPILREKLLQIRQGAHYAEMEARIANASHRYTWNRLRATAQQDQNGHPLKVIGVIIDIDSEKRKSQALQDKAERDSMTKLYNQNTSRRQTEEYLATRDSSERAAMLIIDLDNFKEVNDHYGHMFGNAVLVQISAEINNLFRDNDIVSRIGGDEFMVFMKKIPSAELVENRCQKLISVIRNLYRDQLTDHPLSCSIGVAFIPEHGTSFQDLFQRADRALYKAKGLGKGRYVCYDLFDTAAFPHSAVGKRTNSENSPMLSTENLAHYVFDLLQESGDVEHTITSVLEMAGRQMNVSRVYILEADEDRHFFRSTFQWHNGDVSPVQTCIPEISIADYRQHFNERGIFYCPDTSQLPQELAVPLQTCHIKSLLQCAIRDSGTLRGLVGFDECALNRLWTQDQIDFLSFLSQMLSALLLQKRAYDRAKQLAENLSNLLNHWKEPVFVVDSDSCRLLFLNHAAQRIAPSAAVGSQCFQTLMGITQRCSGCPAILPQSDAESCVRPSAAIAPEAIPISWGGQRAWMMVYHPAVPSNAPSHTPDIPS